MHAILWIALFLTVWVALAIWTLVKSRRMGIPFDRQRRVVVPGSAPTTEQRSIRTTMPS